MACGMSRRVHRPHVDGYISNKGNCNEVFVWLAWAGRRHDSGGGGDCPGGFDRCAQTAEEVIEKNIKAQGGRNALTNLKSIQRKGKVAVDGTFGQMEGTVEEVVIPWKKAMRDLDLAVFVQTDGFNGKVAWRDGMMGLQELEGDEAVQIKQAVDVNPFLMAAEARHQGREAGR